MPHSAGMLGLVNRGFELQQKQNHLANVAARAGYDTALAGIQHESKEPETLGYQHLLTMRNNVSDWRFEPTPQDAAAAYLAKVKEPFFLSVGFWQTHRPFDAKVTDEDTRYVRPPTPLADSPQTRRDMAGYMASAKQLDEGVGAVLAALDKAGLADNTVVIYTTDHGPAFPTMKCNLTDHGISVALIMRFPDGAHAGNVCDAMVSHIDVTPTLHELMGLAAGEWCEGSSLLPLLDGQCDTVRDTCFAEMNYHSAYEPMRCVRTERYKYIRRYLDRDRPVMGNCAGIISKQWMLEHGLDQQPYESELLFDLVFDPQEHNNLAKDTRCKEILTQMRGKLADWMQQSDDPLLNGHIPQPEGTTAVEPDFVTAE